MDTRKLYLTDVSDEEGGFVAPYLAMIDEHAPSTVAIVLDGRTLPKTIESRA